MVKCFLMHKDNTCGVLSYDNTMGRIVNYRDLRTGESPFLGNSDDRKIKKMVGVSLRTGFTYGP